MTRFFASLLGPAAWKLTWAAAIFSAAVAAILLLYLGMAMAMAMRKADDEVQASIRYWIFRDLLGLFCRRGK